MRHTNANRRLVLAGLLCAAGLPSRAATRKGAASAAPKIQRVTKAVAHYQDKPKGLQSCATCTLFRKPSSCKVVIGKVGADGWCMLFDMVD